MCHLPAGPTAAAIEALCLGNPVRLSTWWCLGISVPKREDGRTGTKEKVVRYLGTLSLQPHIVSPPPPPTKSIAGRCYGLVSSVASKFHLHSRPPSLLVSQPVIEQPGQLRLRLRLRLLQLQLQLHLWAAPAPASLLRQFDLTLQDSKQTDTDRQLSLPTCSLLPGYCPAASCLLHLPAHTYNLIISSPSPPSCFPFPVSRPPSIPPRCRHSCFHPSILLPFPLPSL